MIASKGRYAAASGALFAGAGLPFALASWTRGTHVLEAPMWLAVCAASTIALGLGAGSMVLVPWLGRTLALLGSAGVIALAMPGLLLSPAFTLASVLVLTLLARAVFRIDRVSRRREVPGQAIGTAARSAALVGLCVWLTNALARNDHSHLPETLAVLGALFAGCTLGASWALRSRQQLPARARWVLGTTLLACGASALAFTLDRPALAQSVLALGPVAVVAAVPASSQGLLAALWELLLGNAARLLLATFAALCTIGTLLLLLPLSAAPGQSITLIDAAFTAVSAVCVTGLTVLDTPNAFSAFGEAALLVLIQLGGLGIMAFSTAIMRFLGRRMSMRHEDVAATLVSAQDRGHAFDAARLLLRFTFTTELLGTLVMLPRFMTHKQSFSEALWNSVFTSVSAFCNAGFALRSNNLVDFQHDPIVLHAVALLIVLGGLSPAVAVSVPDLLRRRHNALVSAQAKLVLTTTVTLLVVGCAAFLATEWNGTLAHLSVADRFHNAWLQSATLRTAGFNSIDMMALHEATVCMMIVWMFVGGSPGGTAGGIKTTTAAILTLAVIAAIRGEGSIVAFRRHIGHGTVYRAAAIATLGLAAGFAAVVAVLLTQDMPTLMAAFEVVSAMGTVGLTIGGTPRLDDLGKLIIMVCMFAGRVGPLTLFMFLSRGTRRSSWQYPTEDVEVG